jgi:hypothetical protein
VPEFPPKVEAALNAGEVWKARDHLRGRIASSPYSPDLYEQLGVVLLRMGDLPDAGKYLFLSGRREPGYDAAIELFLRRHGRHGWQQLVASLPHSARRASLHSLPTPVLAALEQRGLTISEERGTGTASLDRTLKDSKSPSKVAGCVVSGVLGVLGLLGAGALLAWVIGRFLYPAR